jgi:hypothetical protein
MSSQNAVNIYEALLSSSAFLFIVCKLSNLSHITKFPYFYNIDYRGHWCPFCTSYLATLQTLSPEISFHGRKTLVVTSEPEEYLPATRKSSGYKGEAIVDSEIN